MMADYCIRFSWTINRFKSKVYQNLIINSIALNIDVKIEINPKTKQKEFNANSSDKAFFDFLEDKLDTRYEECLRTYLSDKSKVKNLPFDSEKKCMSTIVKNDKFEIDGFRCFHKGGGDEILKKCSYFFNLETNKRFSIPKVQEWAICLNKIFLKTSRKIQKTKNLSKRKQVKS